MKYTTYSLLVLLICGFAHQVSAQEQPFFSRIDSLAKATLYQTSTTGAYLSMSRDSAVVFSSSYGYNEEKTESVISDASVFPISSNTKAFTSLLIAQEVNANKLEWHAPLKQYLRDFQMEDSYLTAHVSVMDLLTHRWGIPRYDLAYYSLSESQLQNPNKAVFDKLKFMETTTPFRTHYQYGNTQYIIAAYLLEVLNGQKWEELLKERVLGPLGMEATHADYERFVADEGKVVGHQNGKPVSIEYAKPMYRVSGMGNLFSTVKDLEKWCDFLLYGNEDVIGGQSLAQLMEPQFTIGYEEPYPGFSALQYGLGWFVFDYFGHKVVMHHGDNVGHQSMIVLLPDDKVSWRIIANEGFDSPSFPFVMTFGMLDLFVGRELTDWNRVLPESAGPALNHPDSLRTKNTEATIPFMDVLGTYRHEGFGDIVVKFEGGKVAFAAGDYKGSLKYWEYDSYRTYSKVFQEDFIFKFSKEGEQVYLETDLVEPSVELTKFQKVD